MDRLTDTLLSEAFEAPLVGRKVSQADCNLTPAIPYLHIYIPQLALAHAERGWTPTVERASAVNHLQRSFHPQTAQSRLHF